MESRNAEGPDTQGPSWPQIISIAISLLALTVAIYSYGWSRGNSTAMKAWSESIRKETVEIRARAAAIRKIADHHERENAALRAQRWAQHREFIAALKEAGLGKDLPEYTPGLYAPTPGLYAPTKEKEEENDTPD